MGKRMEDQELRRIVNDNIRDICHLSQMQVFATSYYQKNYFQLQIDNRVNDLVHQLGYHITSTEAGDVSQSQEEAAPREFTAQELSTYNGENGNPVYVAMDKVVYDLSGAPAWAGGTHNGMTAGQDLTSWFKDCHLGAVSVLEKYPKVGVLKE